MQTALGNSLTCVALNKNEINAVELGLKIFTFLFFKQKQQTFPISSFYLQFFVFYRIIY